MRRIENQLRCFLSVLAIFTMVSSVLAGAIFAKNVPKNYPEEAKVTGIGTDEHANRVHSHVYKLETENKILVLDCGTRFGFSGGECGGDKKIQIGDVIHFRREKNSAYIPITYSGEQTEQKLRIVSEEMK